MKYSETTRSVFQINKEWSNYDFKLPIQRGLVWDQKQKSLLIHSILVGFDVPKVYAFVNDDGVLQVADGKQRLNAAIRYYNGEFPLEFEEESAPDVNGIEVVGKVYAELPEGLQETLKAFVFTIGEYYDLVEEERDELFIRYNNGKKLTAMEINKALVGSRILKDIEPLRKKSFIKNFLGDNQIKKNKDSYVIWQMLLLSTNEYQGLDIGEKSVNKYSRKLKNVGIDNDLLVHIGDVLDYLGNALPVPEKVYSKLVEIPMLFVTAHEALKLGKTPSQFGGWVQDFFSRREANDAYTNTKKGGTAKKKNVQDRLDILLDDMEQNIDKAPEYKTPEVKTPKTRTRRSKKTQVVA